MMILNRIKLAVDRTIAAFSVVVMIALVVCVVWQVFSRYVLNQPSTLTDELARFLMIWVGLLGAAYTVGAQRHLAIDLLTLMLSSRKQALLSVIINLLIFLFAGSVIVTGGVKLIEKTLSTAQVSAAMQIPMGYVYLILPLTGIMMMFYALCFISNGLKKHETFRSRSKLMDSYIALTLFGSFFILVFIGVPISFSIGLATVGSMLLMFPRDIAVITVAQRRRTDSITSRCWLSPSLSLPVP